MSYVRGISVPERLYIVGSHSRFVTIYNQSEPRNIPYYVFHGILRKYVLGQHTRHSDEEFRYRGAILKFDKVQDTPEVLFKWRLSYKDWSIDMWESTLYYIAHTNAFRYMSQKEWLEAHPEMKDREV